MEDPRIQAKKVRDIVLPASHDSATGTLGYELADRSMAYSNIGFLWDIVPTRASRRSLGGKPYSVGPDLYAFILQLVYDAARATGQGALAQLHGGIRCLDLRVYWEPAYNDVYTQHALRAAKLADILFEVGEFLSYPGGKELVILELSHTNFTEDKFPQGIGRVTELVEQYLPKLTRCPVRSMAELAESKLSDLTKMCSQVVMLNTDASITYPPGSPIINGKGWDSAYRNEDVDSTGELANLEHLGLVLRSRMKHPHNPFYSINWTLTPKTKDLVDEAVSRLGDKAPNPLLKDLADAANANLVSFLQQNRQYRPYFNRIAVDWYEDSEVVSQAIQLNTE
jgi:hypothetical protein